MVRRIRVALLWSVWMVCCTLSWSVTVASAADDGRVVIYGVLQQRPDGAVVLRCAQEPGVEYLPFDPSTIMDDVLNIQVQVRGTIRDSFKRHGVTVRVLAVSDITPLTAEYGDTRVIDHAAYGLPGSDRAQIHIYQNKTCYLYPHYGVLVRLPSGFVGHDLRVLVRSPEDDPSAVCENLQGTPLFEITNGDAFTFVGLAGDTLFVTDGPSQRAHGLMAVNLADKRQVLNTVVAPGARVVGKRLEYRQETSKVCPNGVKATRPMVLDLTTGRSRPVGQARCRP